MNPASVNSVAREIDNLNINIIRYRLELSNELRDFSRFTVSFPSRAYKISVLYAITSPLRYISDYSAKMKGTHPMSNP